MIGPVSAPGAGLRAWVRPLAGFLVVLIGLLNVASALRPGMYARVHVLADVLPGRVVSASAAVSVSVAILLVGLALGLGRGKRGAWRIVLVLLAVELVLHLAHAQYVIATAAALLLAFLVWARDEFIGRSQPVRRSGALWIGAALLVTSTVIGWLAVTALDSHLHTHLSAADRLRATIVGWVGLSSPVTAPDVRTSDVVYYLLVAMAATTVLVTGWLVLRAPRAPEPRSVEDELALRSLVAADGGADSLSYFALRDDRALVWAPSRLACVSYRKVGATMLAAGDPLGAPSEWGAAITAFLSRAREESAVPSVVACSESGAKAWVLASGLSTMQIGDEAVLHMSTFSLQGRAARNVRQAVARCVRSGVTVRVARLSSLTPAESAQLAEQADLWLGGHPERGFTMALGRIDPERDPDSVVAVAEHEGRLRALLVLVPWGADGLSLDMMRRDTNAESGVTELMIVRLLEAGPAMGLHHVSLNFAVFREAFERSARMEAGPVAKLSGRILRFAARGSQAESLNRFNAKFSPEWRRRLVLYPPTVSLPRVTWALLRAESLVPPLRRTASQSRSPRRPRRAIHPS